MSIVTLNFHENLEFQNNCIYLKYLLLLKINFHDFWKFIFFSYFFIQINIWS